MSERARKIGARLLERRNELGLSRPQMARRFDEASVTDDYLYRWEHGKVEPSDAYMPAILRAYEMESVADLYAGPMTERAESEETPDLMAALSSDPPPWAVDLTEMGHRIETMVAELLARTARPAADKGAKPKAVGVATPAPRPGRGGRKKTV